MEIVLVDGNSTDNTKKIMQSFKKNNKDFYSVKVLDNNKRIQASGWNIVIKKNTLNININKPMKVYPIGVNK